MRVSLCLRPLWLACRMRRLQRPEPRPGEGTAEPLLEAETAKLPLALSARRKAACRCELPTQIGVAGGLSKPSRM